MTVLYVQAEMYGKQVFFGTSKCTASLYLDGIHCSWIKRVNIHVIMKETLLHTNVHVHTDIAHSTCNVVFWGVSVKV